MTREQSWNTAGATLALLRQVADLGYAVAVFRLPSSMRGAPATVEMQATDARTDPPAHYTARVIADEHADPDYACACVLAELVGVDLEG